VKSVGSPARTTRVTPVDATMQVDGGGVALAAAGIAADPVDKTARGPLFTSYPAFVDRSARPIADAQARVGSLDPAPAPL